MAAATWTRPHDLSAPQPEQRMLIRGVSWKDYVILREALDTPGLRMTFCEGVLELLLPQLDFGVVARFVTREDQDVALREFAAVVRNGET
jgi:hypothetical protein